MGKITSKAVMSCNEERSLTKIIGQRKLKFTGHIIREESIEELVVEGKIAGNKAKSRQRMAYMEGAAALVVYFK